MRQPATCQHCGGHDWWPKGFQGWMQCGDCDRSVPPYEWIRLMQVEADKIFEAYKKADKI
jgi:hypothetical protein